MCLAILSELLSKKLFIFGHFKSLKKKQGGLCTRSSLLIFCIVLQQVTLFSLTNFVILDRNADIRVQILLILLFIMPIWRILNLWTITNVHILVILIMVTCIGCILGLRAFFNDIVWLDSDTIFKKSKESLNRTHAT